MSNTYRQIWMNPRNIKVKYKKKLLSQERSRFWLQLGSNCLLCLLIAFQALGVECGAAHVLSVNLSIQSHPYFVWLFIDKIFIDITNWPEICNPPASASETADSIGPS